MNAINKEYETTYCRYCGNETLNTDICIFCELPIKEQHPLILSRNWVVLCVLMLPICVFYISYVLLREFSIIILFVYAIGMLYPMNRVGGESCADIDSIVQKVAKKIGLKHAPCVLVHNSEGPFISGNIFSKKIIAIKIGATEILAPNAAMI